MELYEKNGNILYILNVLKNIVMKNINCQQQKSVIK